MQTPCTYVLVASNKSIDKAPLVNSLNNAQALKLLGYRFINTDSDQQHEFQDLVSKFKSMFDIYPFEERPNIFDCPSNIKWIIIQKSFDSEKRSNKTIRQSNRREFNYYQKKIRQISGYFGIPIIDTSNQSIDTIIERIAETLKDQLYSIIKSMALKGMTFQKMESLNIQIMLTKQFDDQNLRKLPNSLIQQLTKQQVFGNQIFELAQQHPQFKRKLLAKWLVSGKITSSPNRITVERENLKVQINIPFGLFLSEQGESKLIYKVICPFDYFNKFVYIILKSTIYSHKKQSTGLIQNLGKVRAFGSKIFLQFLIRNDINHAYRCINQEGIIFSEFQKVTPIQIVFKKYFVGTDKHSYYGMDKYSSLVEPSTGLYQSGIYIRFDWRNPNHISVKTHKNIAQNPYYFVIQNHMTKNVFFDTYLNDSSKSIPFGDKCVYPQLLERIISTQKARLNVIKLYCCFEYYMRQVGLQILDGCFMLNQSGDTFWSQINPDCMRIKSNSLTEEYDKDIWRVGGSSSKELILKKWSLLNNMLTEYLKNHRNFLAYDYPYKTIALQILKSPNLIQSYKYIYTQLAKPKTTRKQVIVTIDISQQMPSLVVSSKVSETHSSGRISQAIEKIHYFDDILMVDLDGAFGDKLNSKNNRNLIIEYAKKHHVLSGGGIHSIKDVEELLNNGVRKIVIASNTSAQFLQEIPKDRLIVELSINETNEVLIHGRKTNTNINVIVKMRELVSLGVRVFSVTFVKKEGHLKGLPYEQIQQLYKKLPTQVDKLIIAGGITSIEDLRFLWRFQNVVPQLGSAIWKNKISVGQVYKEIANFNEQGLIPAIIKSDTDIIKGQVFLNQQALSKTVQSGYLYRYSREHQRVMKKGETSQDFQKVLKVSFDCDADCILVTVDSNRPFCHLGVKSCFCNQNISLGTIKQVNRHILSKIKCNSYSGIMQRNPGLALSKVFQEAWEIVYSDKKRQVPECSDLLCHFLMYMNGAGIQFQDVIDQLNCRSEIIKKITKTRTQNKISIGIEKSYQKINYDVLLNELGIKITKDSTLEYEIINQQKYQHYFGQQQIRLLKVSSLDIIWLLTIKVIDMAICLDSVLKNFPQVSQTLLQTVATDFQRCLLKRVGEQINLKGYNTNKKLGVASKFPKQTYDCLISDSEIDSSAIKIYKLNDWECQNYLLEQSNHAFDLCDALIFRKQIDPRLQIYKIIEPQVKVGLYKSFSN